MKEYVNSFNRFNENRMNPKEDETDGLSWYYGIADCHGIESFIKSVDPDRPEMDQAKAKAAELAKKAEREDRLKGLGLSDKGGEKSREEAKAAAIDKEKQKENAEMSFMSIRCGANAQRHAIVYKVLLQEEVAEMVEDLKRKGKSVNALKLIKKHALEVQIGRGTGVNAEKAWKMIPNPKLDPFS